MASYGIDERLEESRRARQDYWNKLSTIRKTSIVLGFIAISIIIIGYMNQHMNLWTQIVWLDNILNDFYANASSELISIVITAVVLDEINERRKNEQELKRLKGLLSSKESVVTHIAIAELRALDWLQEGKLNGMNLSEANLQNANLIAANFEQVDMYNVNLQDANLNIASLKGTILSDADLRRAKLIQSDLRYANLANANLENAKLVEAKLEGAEVRFANLQHADLAGANLKGASLMLAKLDNVKWANEDGDYPAILPDGTTWSIEVDLEIFTNPNHTDFNSTLIKIEKIRKSLTESETSD